MPAPDSTSEPSAEPAPCCPPQEPCCPPQQDRERPGYTLCDFVEGWQETPVGEMPRVARRLSWQDVLGRWQMRWGLGRDRYRVAPGLYALGTPKAVSPVLVTANYKLTFDVVRRDTADLDAWLLVLDTRGINVWCAAGKGTFGTEELIHRVRETGLERVVDHRRLIVPQLGAVGVAAHEVKKACGFGVVYGPVRIADLQPFLAAGMEADEAMRRVTFSAWERAILTPVELTAFGRRILWAALVLLVLGGIGPEVFSLHAAWVRGGSAVLAGLAGLAAGAVLAPILLPWLPGRAFALKGAWTGLGVGLLALISWGGSLGLANAAALVLAVTAVASFAAMNFTGSSTYTSPSGVEHEMRRAIPLQGLALILAAILWIAAAF